MQHDLKFNQQFDKMFNSLEKANNLLIRYFKREKWLNNQSKIAFAEALVRSMINYGLLIYLNATRNLKY